MSQDQKPAGMRVVSSASGSSQPRRREDSQGGAGALSKPATAARAASVAGSVASSPARPVVLLALIFLAGCMLGGVALVMLRMA